MPTANRYRFASRPDLGPEIAGSETNPCGALHTAWVLTVPVEGRRYARRIGAPERIRTSDPRIRKTLLLDFASRTGHGSMAYRALAA